MKARLLIAAFCFAVVGCTLVDAPLGPNQVPDTPNANRVGYYVSPDGRADGDGSKTAPWDLQTALSQPPKVQPGDTIWMLGGTYKNAAHDYISKLTGTADAPVVLRAYPGERATIDGRLDVNGSYAYYWGFEVMDSDPNRVTTLPGSDPADLPRQNVTVFVVGPFNTLINLVVHDLGDGLFSGATAEGLEIYGSLFYNNGWQGPDRGHGHNIYLQNQNATKYVLDNVLFSSFDAGLHIYGSDAAYLWNFDIEGNTIFDSGSPVAAIFGRERNVLEYGAGGRFGHSVYKDNSIYHISAASSSVEFGTAGGPPGQDIKFEDNIVKGYTGFNEVQGYVITGNKFTSGTDALSGQSTLVGLRMISGQPLSANIWDRNTYATPAGGTQDPFYIVQNGSGTVYLFPGWQSATGYDANGSFTSGTLSGADIIIRPNKYEPGRAFITCWNWQSAASLAVDLSAVLKPGDRYEIHHVYDVFGPPVVSGTYNGDKVNIPQTGYVAPTPIGYSVTPASTSPSFNVFLVEKM